MNFDKNSIEELNASLARLLNENHFSLSTAESCTGGGIAHTITSRAGSSAYFKGSVVSYCDEIKENILHVPASEIEQHTAVSAEVVKFMSENVRQLFQTDFSVATSGIAGPTGGTEQNPVGTIWFAVATPDHTICKCVHFAGNRTENMQQAIFTAIELLIVEINNFFKI